MKDYNYMASIVGGIDISKKQLDCYLLDRKTAEAMSAKSQIPTMDLSNWPAGWPITRPIRPRQSFSEHTGRYGEHLLRWTTANEWAHAVNGAEQSRQ